VASGMEIVLVGLNHRTASVEVRERVSFTTEQARRAAEELRARGILEETLVLSTCNRSEVYGVPPEASHECAAGLSSFLSEFHSVRPDVLRGSLYHHYDREAVRHLFRVSAGLDSMLLGEAEILGQVREAYRFAHENGATGPVLNRLFQGALEVGKRVRTETELGTRPVSVASAGVKLAERIFGKLNERTALVLGAGAISEQVVEQLRSRGIAHLFVMNRSRERAENLAQQFGGKVIAWGEIGLDYFYDHSPRELQQLVFLRQMELARAAKLPIVIHCRPSAGSDNAWEDCLTLLEQRWKAGGLGGILHCFTGAWPYAKRALDLGFMISFAGNVTFPKAQPIRDAAKEVPLKRLLIETDSPFLAPVPHRGKRNEPALVKEVARQLGELRGLSTEDIGKQTASNFYTFFKLAGA